MSAPGPKPPWLKWVMAFGVWTLAGLAFASQLYLTQAKVGNPVSFGFAAGRALADWYVFAVLSIPVFQLARRFPLDGATRWRHGLVHLAGSAVFSILWMILRAGLEAAHEGGDRAMEIFSAAFQHALVATFFFNLLVYWVVLSVGHTFEYNRRFHERELRSADLEKRLTQARLQALQMQLNPHFLFNTLHAISSLMHSNVDAADRMLARLSELLRYALESTDEQEVSLKQELRFLDRYLEIEQTRFGERLSIVREVDPATSEAMVPNLILQPLLENAIRHGVERQSKPGVIRLSAARENGFLSLKVRDNGAGLRPGAKLVEGVGLSNTRARLQQLYGQAHEFQLGNAPEGGFLVTVRLPWRSQSGISPQSLVQATAK